MLELGEQGSEMHRHCGREIAAAGVDRVIGVRGLANELVSGAKDAGLLKSTFSETPEAAADVLLAELQAGDLVLIKGSRGVRTERIVEKLVEKLKAELGGKTE